MPWSFTPKSTENPEAFLKTRFAKSEIAVYSKKGNDLFFCSLKDAVFTAAASAIKS